MKLNKGYFVIGTDTGIGKTYISTLLHKGIKKYEGGYYKPVQSGCFEKNGKITAPDVDFLCNFNNIPYDNDMVTYLLEPEVSPHLASEIERKDIDVEKIIKHWEKLKEKYKYMIVEGAGGLYVPIIRDKFYIYDMIKKLNLPVIVVCSSRVGAINHSMLTINALNNMGISIQGLIFNSPSEKLEYFEKDNIDIVLKLSGIKNYLIVKKDQKEIEEKSLLKFLEIEKF